METLFDRIAHHARLGRLAVIDGGERWSYAELDLASRRAAAGLRALGVARGDRVAIAARNRAELLAGILGCARVGAAAVLIRPMQTAEQAGDFCARLGIRLVLADGERAGELAAHAAAPPVVELPALGGEDTYDAVDLAEDDPAFIFHTSGSTARPKAVCHTWGAVHRGLRATARRFELGPGDVTAVFIDATHCFGLLVLALPTLLAGGTVLCLQRFAPRELVLTLERERATVTAAGPGYLEQLAGAARELGIAPGHLRLVLGGADTVSERLHDLFARAMGLPITVCWGSTELGTAAIASRAPGFTGAIGTPLDGVATRVVDPDSGRDLPPDERGELWVRADFACAGYADADTPSPFVQQANDHGGPWLRTGDLVVRRPDGAIAFAGRRGIALKRGGIFVSPVEVEAILGRHPSIEEALVVGRPSSLWGEEPIAYLVPRGQLDAAALFAFVGEALGEPSRPVAFYAVPALPRDPLGKLVRRDAASLLHHAAVVE